MEERKVLVSVILPVYNVEQYLEKCLTSLVNQTLADIEIIAVDDGSTDLSGNILDRYAQKYSDKLFVVHTENHGQGIARNLAIEKSCGSYIAFCDGDDYYELNGLEKMYAVLNKEKCELVYSASYRLRANHKYILGELSTPVTKESILLEATPFTLWSLLVDAKLLKKTGEIPDMLYEDVAYIPGLISQASKIGYCSTPVYYWLDREGSSVHRIKDEKILDFITAVEIALKAVDARYQDELLMNLANKIVEKVKTAWYYGDKFLKYLNSLREDIMNNRIYKMEPDKYNTLTAYLKLAEEPFIDRNIYLNGFIKDKGVISREYQAFVEKAAFREGGRVIVLSEENCNIHSNRLVKKAFEQKNMEFVAGYFALCHIFENGGIYIGSDMKVNGPFDCLRCYRAFFSYLSENALTDKVFGAKKGNEIIGAIIKLIQDEKDSSNASDLMIAARIHEVLKSLEGVEADGKTSYTKYSVALLAPQVCIVSLGGKGINLTECLEFADAPEVVMIPKVTLMSLLNYPTTWQSGQIKNYRYKLKEAKAKNLELKKKNDELNAMLNLDAHLLRKVFYKFRIGRWIVKVMKNKSK